MVVRNLKTLIVGKPLETFRMAHERLPKWKALAVFSSDALSSVAYATQEILIPLSLVSFAATAWSLPIGIAITLLLIIVSVSYWQTIRSYPSGGGAYIVVRENLGTAPSLITGASLLIDYILTVSVSVAAGVEAIASALPWLHDHRIFAGCLVIGAVTTINLRGVRESGTIFAVPTYLFIFSISALLLTGGFRSISGDVPQHTPLFHQNYPEISLFLILKAFSSGCAALTGIEAISDGVPAFRKPESKNAQITLVWMTLILGTTFLGITSLVSVFALTPSPTETIISLLAREVFNGGPFYYLVQFSTAMILFLAANTSYSDFPRVCSLLAKDQFMPRQFASLGDRLVFSNGIFLLGLMSGLLIVLFKGTAHLLIPLYAVGVFLSFTLSQSGMIRYHLKHKEKGWPLSMSLNFLGAVTTGIVLVVIVFTKFTHGAWLVVVVIPLLAFWFRTTKEHYKTTAAQLILKENVDFSRKIKHVVVVPISGIHRGVVDAIKYAKSISKDVRVISVALNAEATKNLKAQWDKLQTGIDLVILETPYRSVMKPIIDYIHGVDRECDDDMLTVVIPEFVTARWWHNIYHNQTALLLRASLMFERGKVVTSVRHHLKG